MKIAALVAGALLATPVVVATSLPAAVPAGAASSAGTTQTAAQLYRQAFATTHSWSVHYVSSSSQSDSTGSKVTLLESGDAGPASGTQTVYYSRGGVNGSITISVIGGITYVKGNVNGLENLAGLSPVQAAASANQWIDFATTNAAFSQVVAGVRSRDIAQQLALSGQLSLGRQRTLNGSAVEAIAGTQQPAGSTKRIHVVLYVRAKGRHVPVEEDSVTAKGRPDGTFHVTYSRWGELVRPQAPLAAITIGPVTTT